VAFSIDQRDWCRGKEKKKAVTRRSRRKEDKVGKKKKKKMACTLAPGVLPLGGETTGGKRGEKREQE